MTSHLARLGGVVVRPRRTLRSILEGQGGSMWELFPWILIASATASPVEAGRAVLLMRADVLAGVGGVLAMVAERMGPGLIGAIAGGAILYVLSGKRCGFDRAFDCCLFMLVPWMLLASVGAAISELGAELWFMPHRRLRGSGWFLLARVLAAYGWSLVLFAVVATSVRRRRLES